MKIKILYKWLLLLWMALLGCFPMQAVTSMITGHYTVEQGLPNNIVYCSLKGQDGFMWFGTWYGLCSFDGQKFKSYTIRQNAASDVPPRKIQRMEEDAKGFLWIKTVDQKLYLFDKRTECFHAVYDEIKSLLDNVQIIKVQRTPEGNVLLLTKDKNLLLASADDAGKVHLSVLHDSRASVNQYDWKLKGNIFAETQDYLCWIGTNYKLLSCRKGDALRSKSKDCVSRKLDVNLSQDFSCVCSTGQDIWLGDRTGGIYRVSLQNGDVKRLSKPELSGTAINDLLVTSDGLLYVSTSKGVFVCRSDNTQALRKISVAGFVQDINQSFQDKYDKIWFVQDRKGIVYYDPLTDKSEYFAFPQGLVIDFDYSDAGEQGLFILSPSGDILHFDRNQRTMTSISQFPDFKNNSAQRLQFYHQCLDNDGILWLSSCANGVYQVNFSKKQFKIIDLYSSNRTSSATDNSGMRAIFQAKNGDIWVGTRWNDLYKMDAGGHVKQVYSAANYAVGNVYHVMEDHRGYLWFSTKGEGLVRAIPDSSNPLGYRFARFKSDAKNPNSIRTNDVYFTFEDSRHRIWAGLLGGGLNLLQETDSEVKFIHKNNGLANYPPYGLYMEVRNMAESKDGRLWVGTMDGLMSFKSDFNRPEDIHFETYRASAGKGDIAEDDVYVLYRDSSDQIWLSVFGGGLSKLVRYDEKGHHPVFKTYGLREGLDNDVVMSIVEDSRKGLWFATEDGLLHFDRQTEMFKNYDRYDGFPTVKMEENSALHARDGQIWLGTKQGILMFNPEEIKSQSANYKVFIVDFKVSNKELNDVCDSEQISIKYLKEITLRHNQSMFTIEFAALNFVNQNRIAYKYILDGYEKEWHFSGRNRIASYVNVPPGTYKFRVQALDEANAGQASETVLKIVITPPWWFTWWAKLLYFILGIALLYLIAHVALLIVRMRNDVYVEQKLSDLKIKFFTNVSHELRTPLTLIQSPLQELKEKEPLSDKGRQYVDLMEKNANQMLSLVNQLLDLRKIQNGKMRLHVSHINLNEFIGQLEKEFHVLSEEEEISLTFQTSEEPIGIWADKDKISIVLRNVLSNAFKFTPSGGSIFVSVGLTEDKKSCYIRVEDSGEGVPKELQTDIFERFSQGENARNIQGTGIGLALSKEIVQLHQGKIEVENAEPHGAVFTIELLLGKEHYNPQQVDFYMGEDERETKTSESEPDETMLDLDDDEDTDNSFPSVLIVEDNRDLSNMLKMQLDDRYNIYLAANGVEGLKKIHLYHPDIVVTDQMMPEMDGLEMLQNIRKDFQISHTPVIFLTAKGNDESKTKTISLGANAYITKPFSKDYLIARIEQLLGERNLFREHFWQAGQTEKVNAKNAKSNYEQYLVQKDVELLNEIHQVIEQNMDNSDFNIDTIASSIGWSRSAFFKKVKSLTGLAPVDLVKEIRLNKSIELIKNTNLSISEIAFAVGFKDSGYFGKCFRKKYGQTPREYITEWRKG